MQDIGPLVSVGFIAKCAFPFICISSNLYSVLPESTSQAIPLLVLKEAMGATVTACPPLVIMSMRRPFPSRTKTVPVQFVKI